MKFPRLLLIAVLCLLTSLFTGCGTVPSDNPVQSIGLNGGSTVSGDWAVGLVITFKELPDAETRDLAARAGAIAVKGGPEYQLQRYDHLNRAHREFITAAQARGAELRSLK